MAKKQKASQRDITVKDLRDIKRRIAFLTERLSLAEDTLRAHEQAMLQLSLSLPTNTKVVE